MAGKSTTPLQKGEQHQDDWSCDKKSKNSNPIAEIRYDDVVHAYRWILGREPESSDVIQTHLNKNHISIEHMRRDFLRSPEFFKRWKQIPGVDVVSARSDVSPYTTNLNPIVFFHIPKTGGSTVNYHLEQAFSDQERCEIRHNNILTSPLSSVMDKKLFSGHFDNRILHIIPNNARCLTMIREPKKRLFSIYKYFNTFSIEKINLNNFALAKAAMENDFTTFLELASELNAGAIDNSYVRTFGMTLPANRWEMAAESSWQKQSVLFSDTQLSLSCDQSILLLEKRFKVFFFEEFDESIHKMLKTINIKEPSEVKHFKNLRNLPNKGYEELSKKELKFEDSPILEKLTKYDKKIYDHFRSLQLI